MTTSFVLTPQAESDLTEVVEYIAADNSLSAAKFLDNLESVFVKLGDNPKMGHLRPDLTSRPVRFWPIGNYLVVYKDTKPVQIIRVLSGFRNVSHWL